MVMMCSRALFALTLLLGLTSSIVCQKEYIIVVHEGLCEDYTNTTATCKTADQLDQVSQHIESVSLTFTQGQHFLSQRHSFVNISSIHLAGNSAATIIACTAIGSGFQFHNIGHLIIDKIEMTGCSSFQNGGAISVSIGDSIQIVNSTFSDNAASFADGGAVYIEDVNMVAFDDCAFIGNGGGAVHITLEGGAVHISNSSTVRIHQTLFTNNFALRASCFWIQQSNTDHTPEVTITRCKYTNNTALSLGGVLEANSVRINIIQCNFDNNTSAFGGVFSIDAVEMNIEQSTFKNNSAAGAGVMFANNSYVTSTACTYTENDGGIAGGVFFVQNSTVDCTANEFIHNLAVFGGVIVAESTRLTSSGCTFAHNKGSIAGSILTMLSNATVSMCTFKYNSAELIARPNSTVSLAVVAAGAIFTMKSVLVSTNSTYDSNSALHFAGALYTMESTVTIENNTFMKNYAEEGAAVYSMFGETSIGDTNFVYNKLSIDGVGIIIARSAVLTFKDRLLFRDNNGSLSSTESEVEFQGEVIFSNNLGVSGGAITSTHSTLTFTKTSTVTIRHNKALYGGGLSLRESVLVINTPTFSLIDNMASVFGGALYAVQSQMEFRSTQTNSSLLVTENKAVESGGGFYMISSQVQHYRGVLRVDSNQANMQGGAFYMESNSKIFIYKETQEYYSMVSKETDRNVLLIVSYNCAAEGGAVYVADTTNSGTLCRRSDSIIMPIATVECFLQTIQLYTNFPFDIPNRSTSHGLQEPPPPAILYSNIILRNNTPGAIFGGLLDRCVLNPLTELLLADFQNTSMYSSFDYFKLLIEYEGLLDYDILINDNSGYPNNIIANITNSIISDLITSNAVQVCYCQQDTIDCSYLPPPVSVKKGERFIIRLATVDQVGNPVEAAIISRAESSSGKHRLSEGQGRQMIQNQSTCTDIEYNVFATDESAEIHIYADGPCIDQGMSVRVLEVTFAPCTCPVGFQPNPSDIECICSCNEQLAHHTSTCSIKNETFNVTSNVWIGLSNDSEIGLVIQQCPFDYCRPKPITVSVLSTDEQCAFNRSGKLCGKCQEGLSLVLGTSRCQECSSYFVFLLLPFAFLGIALVAVILALNMTVATGTINGLIFYANILVANHSIFLPFSNFLTGFVSWVNLDLGIETCFYDGMDAYGKLLLQLVFPNYLFLLMLIIIIAAECSQKVSTYLGKHNPIAALSTLILLSYSKLLRIIIESLQHTTLVFPNGTTVVWLLDANIQYFAPTHIPRFIIAIIIIILGAIYTILLLFGQCFNFCSRMKWVRKPKYNAFIDAYQAPFVPRHRYWVGLLLLIRIIHYLLSAFASTQVTILSVGCIVFFLIFMKLLNTKIYKLWSLDTLETSFLMNLGVLAICTYYIQLSGAEQSVASNISMAIAFITFICIIFFHIYEYLIKNTKACQKLTTNNNKVTAFISKYLAKMGNHRQTSNNVERQVTNQDEQVRYRDPVLELTEETVFSNNSTDELAEPPKPPIVTYTVIDNEGRLV